MPVYVLRGAHREADGRIGPVLLEETIAAPSPAAAVKLANARDLSTDDDRINALWLTDPSGNLIWSLRRAD